jgi:hypothetical protein
MGGNSTFLALLGKSLWLATFFSPCLITEGEYTFNSDLCGECLDLGRLSYTLGSVTSIEVSLLLSSCLGLRQGKFNLGFFKSTGVQELNDVFDSSIGFEGLSRSRLKLVLHLSLEMQLRLSTNLEVCTRETELLSRMSLQSSKVPSLSILFLSRKLMLPWFGRFREEEPSSLEGSSNLALI